MNTKLTYRSEKGLHFFLFFWIGVLLLMINPVVLLYQHDFHIFSVLPLAIVIPVLLWLWFDTSYTIQDGKIFYRSAFIKGNIEVSSIRKIEKNKTMWSGLKPALATKGLIIHYLDGVVGEEIYFSPEKKEDFVAELLKINPNIEVVDKQKSPAMAGD